ncbi:uncharacterized protein PADG_12515 [Paracoccidioides brasiliensis Pb18]|uniref:Uncharacterized protein n=1 Tax=Paracoccidioides brasiliensis (strain Pb18) TaxID=502780 RepID=A0A0A0HI61_PARBD|nr:uncharacterized protein PADG_12515 [Paracoccidioides brasiliensis Pb18]KGM85838.1 hypothetical protein PADG_12515 [Paracoccidioides brasiliensis Pb18]
MAPLGPHRRELVRAWKKGSRGPDEAAAVYGNRGARYPPSPSRPSRDCGRKLSRGAPPIPADPTARRGSRCRHEAPTRPDWRRRVFPPTTTLRSRFSMDPVKLRSPYRKSVSGEPICMCLIETGPHCRLGHSAPSRRPS